MQGAPWEAYSSEFPSSLGMPQRDLPILTSYKDLSGNSIQQEPIDITAKSVKEISDSYKALKAKQIALGEEYANLESHINTFKEYDKKFHEIIDQTHHHVFAQGLFTREEIDKYLNLKQEFFSSHLSIMNRIIYHYDENMQKKKVQLEDVNCQLGLYINFLKESASAMMGEAANPYHCPICFDKAPAIAYVPCGHSFCEDCTKNSRADNCMVCRTRAEKKIKLFL